MKTLGARVAIGSLAGVPAGGDVGGVASDVELAGHGGARERSRRSRFTVVVAKESGSSATAQPHLSPAVPEVT